MIVNLLPAWTVDVGGAIMMIVFSFLSVRYAVLLKKRDPQNIVWTYLFWVSTALAVFAVSRSLGHIAKQFLIITDRSSAWVVMRPYSGAVNTITFTVVGSLTLFFARTWAIYQGIIRDRKALKSAHQELLYLNQNLENRVMERTAALAESEQRYRRIFEASRDMILTVNSQGTILDLNPAGLRILGLKEPDAFIEHCRFSDFFFDGSHWQTVYDKIQQEDFVTNTELDLKRADGKRSRVILSGSRETAKDGNIHFVVKDIGHQYVLREQMAQADKLASIGELSAGIAHEINNPLGIILGYTQLMLRQETDDMQRREDLKIVGKHVRHCKSIVEDLLNFARTSKSEKKLLDIHPIIDEVLNFIAQHTRGDGIQIEKKYDERIGPLMMDEKKIKQVLINLLMNANHAMAGSGTITIQTEPSPCGRRVFVRVRDTGKGIDAKNLSRIFDPFFTTKPTGKGTGLGLSVSYGIIKNHGGDITVESPTNGGTTFTIALPTAEALEISDT